MAVTILAIVITAVYGVWSVGLQAWRHGEDATAMFQRQRIVLDTLSELTKSVLYFNSDPSLYRLYGQHNETEGDSISFVTASDALLQSNEMSIAGMRRVTIWMSQDQFGRPVLAIANTPALELDDPPQPISHVFSADVSGFTVKYSRASTSEWRDDWQEENAIPNAVEFIVTFGTTGDRIPPITVTRAIELPAAQYANLHHDQSGNSSERTASSSGESDSNQ